MAKTLKERFEEKYKIVASGCWEWQYSVNKKGYGMFGIATSTTQLAHRVSFTLYKGDIPEGLFVLHHCDNPKCVNPEHLFLGTNTDNMRDAKAKGRLAKYQHPSESHYSLGCRCEDCKHIHKNYLKQYRLVNAEKIKAYKLNYRLSKKI